MRILLPAHNDADHATAASGSGGTEPLDEAALADFYRYPTDRPWLRSCFVATLDGAAQGPDHRAGSISGTADQRVLAMQRALSDVVLVGAATARIEGYRPIPVRREHAPFRAELGMPGTPPTAIVSGSLDVPEALLQDPRTIVLTTESSDAVRRTKLADRVDVTVVGERRVEPTAAIQTLFDRGHRRILCEGGPNLLAEYVAAELVDELCLSWSPLLRGGQALSIINGPELPTHPRFRLAGLLEEDSYLFGRWVRL